MVSSKVLVGVSLVLTVIALVIKSVAISVPHFVDVHLIRDINDQADSNRIAGVGVFQSEFDTETDDAAFAAEIDEAGLPILKVESPSTEFPLLFPGQENFIAEVLPLDAELVTGLDAAFPGENLATVLQPTIDAIGALEFDGCSEYINESFTTTGIFFTTFQLDTLPIAISGIITQTAATVDAGLSDVAANIAVSAQAPGLAVSELAEEVLNEAAAVDAANCGALIAADGAGATFDANLRGCLASAYGTVSAALASTELGLAGVAGFLAGLLADDSVCPDNIGTINDCFLALSQGLQLVDNAAAAAATFTVGDICAVPQFCGNTGGNLKIEYLTSGALLVLSNIAARGGANAADAAGALQVLGGYGIAFEFGLVEATFTFAEGINAAPLFDKAASAFPANATDAYGPCLTVSIASALTNNGDATALFGGEECEDFNVFLTGLVPLLTAAENPLVGDVEDIVELYQACLEATDNDLEGCPVTFTAGLIDGAYNGIDVENNDFVASAIDACEEDEEDKSAIETAQILVIVSIVTQVLATILMLAGVFVGAGPLRFVAPSGSLFAVLAGVTIISALLVVRGAPVYDGVGEEPTGELEAIFIQGYVPILAIVDALLLFISSIVLCVATFFAVRESGEEVEEAKEVEDEMEQKI